MRINLSILALFFYSGMALGQIESGSTKDESLANVTELELQSRFSLGISLAFKNKVSWTDAKFKLSGQNYSGFEVEYEFNNAYILNAGYELFNYDHAGFTGSLFYIPELKFSSYSVSYAGERLSASVDSSAKLSIAGLEALANYRFKRFLLLGGVNYSSFNLSSSSGSKSKSELTPNIGVTLAARFFPKDHFSIDLYMRGLGLKVKTTDPNGDSIDTGFGYFNIYSLGLTYFL